MKLIQSIRDSRTGKIVFTYILLNFCFEIFQPTVSLALTSGPSQPEVQSFEPVSTSDMVDVFSGDFNYNIPLMNIPGPNGGYPINLAYHAGTGMDEEASWVGLGWNINSGALVRNVRGLPDDFDSNADSEGNFTSGDFIEQKTDQKPSVTGGVGIQLNDVEIFGGQAFEASWQINVRFNNYRGLGYSIDYGLTYEKNDNAFTTGLSLDSDDGLGVNVSYSHTKHKDNVDREFKSGIGFYGESGLTTSLSLQKAKHFTTKTEHYQGGRHDHVTLFMRPDKSSTLSFTNTNFSPALGRRVDTYTFGFRFKSGSTGLGFFSSKPMSLYFSTEDYAEEQKEGKRYPVMGYDKMGNHLNDEYYTKDFSRQRDGFLNRQTPVLPHSYYNNDAYVFTGHGTSGYFRGRRADIGRIHDPKVRNDVYGFNGSLEFRKFSSTFEFPLLLPGMTSPVDITIPVVGQHVGFGVDFTYGWSTQHAWNTHNDQKLDFKKPGVSGKKENVYYQVHGQPTVLASNEMTHIGGEAMFRPKLKHVGMERGIDDGGSPLSEERVASGRVVRNTLVHNFSNKEYAKLPEFNSVRYYNYQDLSTSSGQSKVILNSTTANTVNRSNRNLGSGGEQVSINGHNAGFKVLNEDGSYYVYGLPAYNTKEVTNIFSVDVESGANDELPVGFSNNGSEVEYQHENTDKFISKTTKSPYAHSYMLTAIYGADYVDITQNGPTEDDLGYWVKFDYVKYADHYKWRAPYYGAILNKGAFHTSEDDKASYSYGEKEVWYLGRIETKTHVAVYHLSERKDNAEAAGEFTSNYATPASGASTGLKVDKIGLYVKSDLTTNGIANAKPLQEVHFKYDYSLCPGVKNNKGTPEYEIVNGVVTTNDLNSEQGKLTLKSIWFTAQGSKKGEFNKYTFDYESGDPLSNSDLENPAYAFNRVNSWGGYKPGGANNRINKYFPYVDQFNQWPEQGSEAYQNDVNIFEDATAKENFKYHQDQFASAWCLKKIHLPSGGTIKVDYESDDYAYVQDQEATQMFKITDVNDMADGLDKLYDEGLNNFTDPRARRIYFKLEYPIPSTTSAADAADQIYDKYVKNIIQDENNERNLYFRSYVQLKDIPGVAFNEECEAVSGYIPLEDNGTTNFQSNNYYNYGVGTTVVGGNYTHGFVTVKQLPKKSGGKFDHHPISLLSWQFMQTNTPKLMHDFASYDDGSNGNFVQQLANFLNVLPSFMSSVGATRGYARGRNFAKKIDLNRSVIRLCSPDKIKFGGGHRVKKITITDEWGTIVDGETTKTYGTEYDYTMKDENGNTISSGVAQYEPSEGGDENALKYPLHFQGKNTFVSNNNLFAEHPFNEDLFPGASVGYRQVTVKSVNTGNQLRVAEGNTNEGRTGGVTVYNFYTAKEFPTIVEYTPFIGSNQFDYNNDYKGVMNLSIPIPLIGNYTRKYYHASQAFKIELNDMHGKPKSIESFELKKNSGAGYQIVGNPITSQYYEYQSKNYVHNGNNVFRLDNKVKVVSKDSPTQLASGDRDMGVEYDFFTDQRQSKSHTVNAGIEVNLDWPVAGSGIPIPSFWPSFSTHKSLTRTYVTNKVIFKTGILKKTVSRDLQASSSSEIVAYDELSGQPLITKSKNEFGDELYAYNMPAYWNYDRMGHAYKNINYEFAAKMLIAHGSVGGSRKSLALLVEPTQEMLEMLVRGDEILLRNPSNANTSPLKVYYADLTFDSNNDPMMLFYAYEATAADFYANGQHAGFLYNYEFPGSENWPIGKVIRSGRRNHYSATGAAYMTKGNIFDQVVGTNTSIDGFSLPVLNNVLTASASVYRDDWDHSLTMSATDEDLVENPFLSGNSGIWRPYKSYTYVGSRTKSADLAAGSEYQGPNLRTDGVMNNVPMFTHELGDFEDYIPQWEWTSEITRFNSDSYEVENVDRLGVKSAALFGLGNNLSIAVGGNADYHEMGTMDFESTTDNSMVADLLGLTNMTFFKDNSFVTTGFTSETVKIKDLYRESNGTYSVFLDISNTEYNKFASLINNRVGLGLVSRKFGSNPANVGHYLNGTISAVNTYTDGSATKIKLTLSAAGLKNGAESLHFMKTGDHYYGRATFIVNRTGATQSEVTGVNFTNAKAHTGKRSMNLIDNVSFLQQELRLKTGTSNKYVLSFWISRNDENVYRYTTTGSDILTISQVNPSSGVVTSLPAVSYVCSKNIEGWQKIDVTFHTDVDFAVLKLNFTPGNRALYVDDVRLSPRTGGMTTSVYDPFNFRLRASLNVDNYATLYYYDEEGNLIRTKQETENGIVTVNEARGNVRKPQ